MDLYVHQMIFKSFLKDGNNTIDMADSNIDCDQCRNYWMIKDNREKQFEKLFCIENDKESHYLAGKLKIRSRVTAN